MAHGKRKDFHTKWKSVAEWFSSNLKRMSHRELLRKFYFGWYDSGQWIKMIGLIDIFSFSFFQLDAHGHLICPCAHLLCNFRTAPIGDVINDEEFDQFWLHTEQSHADEYGQIIERCRSMMSSQPKTTKVHSNISLDWRKSFSIPVTASLRLNFDVGYFSRAFVSFLFSLFEVPARLSSKDVAEI